MGREEVGALNERNIAEFTSTGGRTNRLVNPSFCDGRDEDGRRTSPLMYLADDGPARPCLRVRIRGRCRQDPAWLPNVVSTPENVTVEIGRETLRATAEVLPRIVAQRCTRTGLLDIRLCGVSGNDVAPYPDRCCDLAEDSAFDEPGR